ncbi:uncharacterized protein VTP21DRAFT_7921 [Calcarisporiella thermophila]|uniref:uncharacterized protein n=1 Tax=Calcarisporiella thermophila TaxID=911321 RepID=UPI003742A2B8
MEPLNLHECREDNPTFRKHLTSCEESVTQLETTIKSLIKLARAGNDITAELGAKQMLFAEELQNFADKSSDPLIENALGKFSKSLQEVERSRKMLESHITHMFIDPLEVFVKDEISPTKDLKRSFERASDSADNALWRYMAKKPRDLETIPEAAREVAEARKDFHAKSIEYSIKHNDLQAKTKHEFLEYILAMMYTWSSFYHQGYEALKDLETYMRSVTEQLQVARSKHKTNLAEYLNYQEQCLQEPVESYNPLQSNHLTKKPTEDNKTNHPVIKSGYLFKKGNQRVMQTWARRYFSIQNEMLVYTSRGKPSKDEEQTAAVNLRLCNVKVADQADRRFCFEVISPQRSYLLQAENEEEMHDWIQCLRNATKNALHSDAIMDIHTPNLSPDGNELFPPGSDPFTGAPSNGSNRQHLQQMREMPGNEMCADCRAPDPNWASTSFGVLLCIECSGIHRSLGVHVSKIRSVTLDIWEPEAVDVMLQLGNTRINSIFESKIRRGEKELCISPDSDHSAREEWITAKYARKEFLDTTEEKGDVDQKFWSAIVAGDLFDALRYLALGANIDYCNAAHNSSTALHQAVLRDNGVAVEFLLQRFCKPNVQDADGRTPLHHAAANDNVRLLLMLLKRQAKPDITDKEGKTALDLAVEMQHPQLVTALRLFTFDLQQHHASPSRSTEFGFKEAISSFARASLQPLPHYDSPSEGRSEIVSRASMDLRGSGRPSSASPSAMRSVLTDDQKIVSKSDMDEPVSPSRSRASLRSIKDILTGRRRSGSGMAEENGEGEEREKGKSGLDEPPTLPPIVVDGEEGILGDLKE